MKHLHIAFIVWHGPQMTGDAVRYIDLSKGSGVARRMDSSEVSPEAKLRAVLALAGSQLEDSRRFTALRT